MTEDQLGTAMKAWARAEGHKPRLPQISGVSSGITSRDQDVLNIMRDMEWANTKQISAALGISPSHASNILTKMWRIGRVERITNSARAVQFRLIREAA